MRLLALRLNKHYLIFSGSLYQNWPWTRPLVGNQPWEAPQGDSLCVPPPFLRHLLITHTHIYTHTDYKLLHIQTHPRTPDPTPPSLWSASLTSGSVTSAAGLALDRMAAVGAGLPPLLHSRVSVLCAFVLRCFSVLTLYSPPKEYSLGVIFSISLSSCLCCKFLKQTPAFHCWLYLVWLCMWQINTYYYYYYYMQSVQQSALMRHYKHADVKTNSILPRLLHLIPHGKLKSATCFSKTNNCAK